MKRLAVYLLTVEMLEYSLSSIVYCALFLMERRRFMPDGQSSSTLRRHISTSCSTTSGERSTSVARREAQSSDLT